MLSTVFLHCGVDGEAFAELILWVEIALWLCIHAMFSRCLCSSGHEQYSAQCLSSNHLWPSS